MKSINQQPNCASIGECMLELSSLSPCDEKSSAFGTQTLKFGGDTLNTAIYMARQNVAVDYITAMGDDHWSDEMLNAWHKEKVGVKHIVQVPERVPGLYAIKTLNDGEREFFYWRNESPARELFEIQQNSNLLSELMSFDYIYLSGITLSLYSEYVLERLWTFFEEYKAQGGKLVFDSNYRPRNWPDSSFARKCFDKAATYSAIVLPTLDDEQLFEPELTLEQCQAYYQNLGVKELVIKMGPKGCLVCTDQETILVKTVPVEAIDTTAAGDSFNGTYLASRMNGNSAQLAAEHAHRVAGEVVQHQGAIIDIAHQPFIGE